MENVEAIGELQYVGDWSLIKGGREIKYSKELCQEHKHCCGYKGDWNDQHPF